MLAIPNSPGIQPIAKVLSSRQITPPRPARRFFWPAAFIASLWTSANLFSADTNQITASPAQVKANSAARARAALAEARSRFRADTNNAEAAWQFARACFDAADTATNNAVKAEVAEQGIAACRQLLGRDSNSVPAHYYLGMDLGQLADTKRNPSAFKIVKEMEREFQAARSLDERLDYAGPDRNLGLLYWQAPIIVSIGSRSKARQHLQRAVELAPDYPENRLNLAEACLKWGDRNGARSELKALEELWPAARKKFSGEDWADDWIDWESRLNKARDKAGETTKPLAAPSQKN